MDSSGLPNFPLHSLKKASRILLQKDGFLESQFQLAGIYLLTWEVLKGAIRNRLETFFANGWKINKCGEMIPDIPSEHINLFTSRDALKNQLNQWKEWGVVTEDDVVAVYVWRNYRNVVAHELEKIVLDDNAMIIPVEHIESMLSLLRKIDNWWLLNFEAATDPDEYRDFSPDEMAQGSSLRVCMLQHMIDQVRQSAKTV
ncbi:MAG: hypothetical protein HQL07_11360 [Nitrospirae bacterium]|nr:hypothetical protein [Magnetococcales bacterium]HAT49993.1 hypothetical protein [Alphaproteobacteria bacterium]